jgi:hypothetical protein
MVDQLDGRAVLATTNIERGLRLGGAGIGMAFRLYEAAFATAAVAIFADSLLGPAGGAV